MKEGPSPLRGGKDKQSVLSVGGDNMGKDEEDQTRRIGVNRVSSFLNKIGETCFSFRRIDHMALKNHLH